MTPAERYAQVLAACAGDGHLAAVQLAARVLELEALHCLECRGSGLTSGQYRAAQLALVECVLEAAAQEAERWETGRKAAWAIRNVLNTRFILEEKAP